MNNLLQIYIFVKKILRSLHLYPLSCMYIPELVTKAGRVVFYVGRVVP